MTSITNDTVAWLAIWAFLAIGLKLTLNYFSKRTEQKREAARRAAIKARRDERDDKRPTMTEALEQEISTYRDLALTGDDEARKINAIFARIVMEDDLGRYANGPRPYEVDQAHRDILLAHARKDAAEALATSRTLLSEVRRLTSALDELTRVAFWLAAAYVLWSWWKSGFALWWQ
jgi:hypothetical protein